MPADVHAPKPLPELEGVDRARFEAEVVPAGRPVVLRGLVSEWPVVAAGRQGHEAAAAHLAALAGPEPVEAWLAPPGVDGRFGFRPDLTGFNFERRLAPLPALLKAVLASASDPAAPGLYAGGVPLGRHLPKLLEEAPMPLLPAEGDRLVSLWVGNRTRTAAHWDLPQNLACVVAGARRFTVFPTEQVANLYMGPLDVTPAGQPISLVDVEAPDFDRHPRFREALAHAEYADLRPGDAIYLPSLWLHHVRSLEPFGAMVNFWWRDGPEWLTTPLFSLFHALLTLKEMPERERLAWRTLFDWYVFRPDGQDPAEHLPLQARGALGELTPEVRARMKALIAGPLSR